MSGWRDPPLTPMGALRWAVVRKILRDLAPRRVLEIGCGQGAVGARIARTSEYVGVEPDPQSRRMAQQRVSRVGGTVVADVADLPAAGGFDVVCAFEVLEHLADDGASLAEWLGQIRPGGSVVASVPAWPARFGPMDLAVGHHRRYRPEDLDTLLLGSGCTAVDHRLYGWPLGYALEAVRNRIAERQVGDLDAPMAARTARSGRMLQPGSAAGAAVRLAVAPFAVLQRVRPGSGTGLVGVGVVHAGGSSR